MNIWKVMNKLPSRVKDFVGEVTLDKEKYIVTTVDHIRSPEVIKQIQNYCNEKELAPKVFYANRNFMVQEYIVSEKLPLPMSCFSTFGWYIAMLHKELRGIQVNPEVLRSMNLFELEYSKRYLEKLFNNRDAQTMLSILDKFMAIMNKVGISKFETSLIDGDLNSSNIIYSKQRLNFIDFDNCTYFPQSYEVLRFFFQYFDFQEADSSIFNYFEEFIVSYNSINKLTNVEWESALTFYLKVLVTDISMVEDKNFFQARALRAQFIADNFKRLKNCINISIMKEKN